MSRNFILGETNRETERESAREMIPVIDFTGLVPGSTVGWDAVQAEVMQALETFGCFEALYNRVTPELREALFSRAVPELFNVPVDVKKLNQYSDIPFQGYVGGLPNMAYESLRVKEGDAEGFTRLMWPQGNPTFCDTISTYTVHLKELEQMVVRMVFRSLGVEKYYESLVESTYYAVRLSELGIPLDQETKVAMLRHLDQSLVTIVCQHLVEGLEVQTREGEWIHVVPLLNSFTVIIGENFQAWTNGRLQSPWHRVRITSNEKRYSVLFGSRPKDGYITEAPKELVDGEHPMLYRPYIFEDYLKFRFSEKGARSENPLKDYCGVGGESADV